jgi:glycosyltransferase involved in cell wall biosynthesis
MAAGRPVITSGLGGAAELVRAGTDALTWDVRDPLSLARAIEQLVLDPGLRAALGARARDVALAKFAPARLADEVSAVYDRAIARRVASGLRAPRV